MRERVIGPLLSVLLTALVGAFSISSAVAEPGGGAPSPIDPQGLVQLAQDVSEATLRREGRNLYNRECGTCHGDEGKGAVGPPLAGNDFLSSRGRVVGQMFTGAEDHGMPAFKDVLDDREIAAIATYVRNSWGNEFGAVLPDYVASVR